MNVERVDMKHHSAVPARRDGKGEFNRLLIIHDRKKVFELFDDFTIATPVDSDDIDLSVEQTVDALCHDMYSCGVVTVLLC